MSEIFKLGSKADDDEDDAKLRENPNILNFLHIRLLTY